MQQLKDMLNGMAAKPKPVEETLEPIRSVDVPLDDPEEPETPEKAPEPPRPTMVFAADKPLPERNRCSGCSATPMTRKSRKSRRKHLPPRR